MKSNLQFIVVASAASVLSLSALAQLPPLPIELAQETPKPKTDAPGYARNAMTNLPSIDRQNDAAQASYAVSNAPAAPNNTARNVRDRNDQTLTPLNQG